MGIYVYTRIMLDHSRHGESLGSNDQGRDWIWTSCYEGVGACADGKREGVKIEALYTGYVLRYPWNS